MTRFGKLFLAVLVLAGLAIGSMIRFRDVAEPGPAPVTTDEAAPSGLVVPVAGVRPQQLADTFGDAREGHAHDAIDIMAPRGTPVIAAMAGTVEKLFHSEAGGLTAYVRSADKRWITYYAHLDSYAPDLREGLYLQRADAVGTVGFTGNASAEGPHLHFEMKRMAPGEAWHQGRAVDPYPLLGGGR